MSIQAMAPFASMLMESHLEVEVDMASVSAVMLTLVRSGLPSGSVSVYLVLLSSHAMESMIGSTLHNQLVCCLLAAASQLPMPAPLESVAAGTKRELVQALAAQHSRGTEWEAHDVLVGGRAAHQEVPQGFGDHTGERAEDRGRATGPGQQGESDTPGEHRSGL